MVMMSNTHDLMKIVETAAVKNGVDPDLAMAIASVESSWDAWAVRFEPNWKYFKTPEVYAKDLHITVETETALQACSYGLMQIMGSVARELGFTKSLLQLADPFIAADFSTRKLATLVKKHPTELDAIAAYNAGKPRLTEAGKYVNQGYVDKVTKVLGELRVFVAAGKGDS